MRIIEIAAWCRVAWSNPYEKVIDRKATEKNLYAANEALLEFYSPAKYVLADRDADVKGVKLESVVKFNEATDPIAIARLDKAPLPDLRAALSSAP